ncbi:unnamed protein product [Effrenium voratum]|nr:unnamed protein product [Effrenium voratum]
MALALHDTRGFGPLRSPAASLAVLLHGRGDRAESLEPLAAQLAEALPATRFLLPTAPVGPHGLNSWYETDAEGQLDGRIFELRDRVLEEVNALRALLGLTMSQVCFLGFSQGAMLASLTALTSPCAGVAALCGGVPWHLEAPCTETPVLLVGGALDGTVTLETTRLAYGRLEALKMKRVQYLELPCLAHEISEEVVGLVKAFFAAHLPHPAGAAGAGALRIPEGAEVALLCGRGARGVVEGAEGEDYWVRLGSERLLLPAAAFVQRLPASLLPGGGEPAAACRVRDLRLTASGAVEAVLLEGSAPGPGGAEAEAAEAEAAEAAVAPHRLRLPLGSVLRLQGLQQSAQRLRPLEGRFGRLRQILPDGRWLMEVGETLVRLHPRHLVP